METMERRLLRKKASKRLYFSISLWPMTMPSRGLTATELR